MDLVAFAAPAANALNLFAGIPALAALFGQPLPLMLAAAMALACVSAEAAAPEATESFPVVITGGPLTMSIPSMLTNLPQALVRLMGGGREGVLWRVGRPACEGQIVCLSVCPVRLFMQVLGDEECLIIESNR
jgi:hypothetical protein